MSRTPGNQHQQQPPQQSHFSQFNLPHSQTSNSSQHLQVINHQFPHALTFQQPSPTHQMIPGLPRPATSQFITSPYIEPPQFLSATTVQPIFSTTTTVISPVQPAPEFVHSSGVALSPAQNQMQSHLQRKHEELQKLIVQQQDELRRVSEQLFIARYGMPPPVVNISLPFPVSSDQPDSGSDVGHSVVNAPSHIYHEQHPQMLHHLQVPSQNLQSPHIQIHQQSQSHHVIHQPPLLPIQYEMNTKKQHSNEAPSTDRENVDIMQYMQHQSHSQAIPQQHIQSNDSFQQLPFELMNSQAQILFSTRSTSDGGNNPSSSKWNY